jgi:hypothetical protein
MRTLLEIVQDDDDLLNAREQIYSKNMEKVLGMLLDGMQTKDIAKQSKLDEKCVKDMAMAMTNKDGKTRRQSMRNIASAARCKKMVAEKKKDVPSKRSSTWVKPQLVSSIFALAQGQYIDMPTR